MNLYRHSQSNGFALVIALSLMSFVLLLLLSITTLVQVEARTAAQTIATKQAQLNAQMGLMLALGELQKNMGADQRVSAEGALDKAVGAGKAHWVGAWSSEDADADNVPDGQFIDWLVSDPLGPGGSYNQIQEDTPVGDQDWVSMVGAGSVDPVNDASDVVFAQRIEIPDSAATAAGHYAWWVGDEGVKARVNQLNIQVEPSFASQGSQRAPIDVMEGYDAVDSLSDPVLKVVTKNSSTLLAGATEASLKQHFHDMTGQSLALQTNTRTGGLKKDLSLLFEMNDSAYEALDPATYAAYVNPTTPISRTENVAKGLLFRDQDIHGPTIDLLRNHYRQYKQVSGAASDPLIVARANYPNKTEFDVGSEDNAGYQSMWRRTACIMAWRWGLINDPGTSDRIQPFFWKRGDFPAPRLLLGNQTPYLNRMIFYASVQSEQDGGGDTVNDTSDDTFKLVLKFQPMLYVHNPYNIRMRVEKMRYLRNVGEDSLFIRRDVQTPLATTKVTYEVDLSVLLDSNNEATPLTSGDRRGEAQFVVPSSVTFEPGEVKIFVPSGAQDWGAVMEMEELGDSFQPDEMALTLDLNKVSGLGNVEGEKMKGIPRGTEVQMSIRWGQVAKQDFEIYESQRGGFNTVWSSLSLWRQSFSTGALTAFGGQDVANAPSYLVEELQTITPVVKDDFFIKPVRFTHSDSGGPSGYPSFVLGNPLSASASNKMGSSSNHGGAPGAAPGAGMLSTMAHSHMDYGASGYPYFTDTISGDRSTWGSNNGSAGELNTIVLEIPTSPLFSLGALQYANIAVEGHQPALAIGNSFPNPTMSDHSLAVEPIYGQQNYDLSYLTNRALWDDYFFSSITPQVGDSSYDSPTADPKTDIQAVITAFIGGGGMLGNSRMALIQDQVNPGQQAAELEDFSLSAAHLAVAGGFNINSISVSAWTAFLSGYRDAALRYKGGIAANAGVSAFPRISLPVLSGEQNPVANSSKAWLGYAQLLDEEIELLAAAIVAENKARAFLRTGSASVTPVLTMGQFVNRMLDGHTEQQMKGILQAAIERSDLNKSINSYAGDFIANNYGTNPDEEVFKGDGLKLKVALSASAPTHILQSDLLQALGAAMTPRSDTFLIRSYGDVLGVSGDVIAKAWCEAVVQRVTEPVRPDALNPWEPEVPAFGEVDFGRRFKIVSMRWLSQEDV
jgi:hypothetical protein